MATYVPAKRATALRFYVALRSQANTKLFQVNPTLAAGDVKVSKDGGAFANLTTLPAVTPAGGRVVQVDLDATEMTADQVAVQFVDAAGSEWCDLVVTIQTAARQIDDLAYPATSGRSMVVDASGLVDANTVKVGPSGSGTAQTAGDIPARLPAALGANGNIKADVRDYSGSAGTFSGGRPEVNVSHWKGTAAATVDTAGYPVVTVKDGTGQGELATTGGALDTITTLTNDPSGVTTLLSRLTSTRAGYLDNLNIGGLVASSAEVTIIQNNTRCVIVVPDVIERPDSGTVTYRVELFLYDTQGNMEAPDSAPTIALVNQAGTDRSSRLDSTTMALVSTGRYRAIYTADVADALEQLVWAFSVIEGSATRVIGRQSLVVDTTAVDFTAADRTKLSGIFDKLPSKTYLTGTQNSDGDVQLNEATGELPTDSVSANALKSDAVTEIQAGLATSANQTTILARLGAFTGSGLNTVLGFFRALLRKDAALTPSDVAGTFDNTTDSLEAIKDNVLDATISSRAATGAAMTLTSGERDAVATALLDLANAVDGYTVRQLLRILGSAEAGDVVVNTGTGQVLIKKLGAPGTTRITADCDEDGNREVTAVNAA